MFDDYNIDEIVKALPLDMLQDKGDHYTCRCPYHSPDTHPSFVVQRTGEFVGVGKCWSCNTVAHVFKMYRELTGGNAINDFNLQANRLNYEFSKKYKQKKTEKKVEQTGVSFVGDLINPYENKELIDYLYSRGMSDEFIEFFQIKYASKILVNDKSLYTDRFVIPIYGSDSELVSFEVRAYTKTYFGKKVLYPSNSKIGSVVFNYENIDLTKPVYCVEGITSLSSVWINYSKNVVSVFGKNISKAQKEILNTIPNLILLCDNDDYIDSKELVEKNNLEDMLSVFDDFYEKEYYIAEITDINSDPNSLPVERLKEICSNVVSSTDWYFNKYQLFEEKEIKW